MSGRVIRTVVIQSDVNPKEFIKLWETEGGDISVTFGDSKTHHSPGIELSLSGSKNPLAREVLRSAINLLTVKGGDDAK